MDFLAEHPDIPSEQPRPPCLGFRAALQSWLGSYAFYLTAAKLDLASKPDDPTIRELISLVDEATALLLAHLGPTWGASLPSWWREFAYQYYNRDGALTRARLADPQVLLATPVTMDEEHWEDSDWEKCFGFDQATLAGFHGDAQHGAKVVDLLLRGTVTTRACFERTPRTVVAAIAAHSAILLRPGGHVGVDALTQCGGDIRIDARPRACREAHGELGRDADERGHARAWRAGRVVREPLEAPPGFPHSLGVHATGRARRDARKVLVCRGVRTAHQQ